MGIFQCCFSGDAGRTARPHLSRAARASPALDRALGTPTEAETSVSASADSKIPPTKLRQFSTDKEWQDSAVSSGKDLHPTNGLECALALQAKLCSGGRTHPFPEARAAFLVEIIQRHLDASAVRLYVVASGYSDGAGRGVEGDLVQLAQALARGPSGGAVGACRAPLGQDPLLTPAPAEYLCPKHEPVGSSSVLLRQALVSKVAVVLRCGPRLDSGAATAAVGAGGPAAAAAHQHHPARFVGAAAPTSSGGGGGARPEFPGVAAAVSAAAGVVAAARSGSSGGYSSCAGHAELDTVAAAARLDATRCCPDLDLTEADAVPGSATLFAAVPLVYGMVTVGVLWIAVPVAADDEPTASDPTAAAAAACSDSPSDAPPPPLPPSQQQQAFCGASRGVPRVVTHASSTLSAAAAGASGPAALLGSPAALEMLAMSVTMHLSTGCADVTHLCRLADSLRGLAESATLAELVLELSTALVRHVRQRFFVDATAHAALVPAADAKVAFMLRPERVEGPGSARGVRHQLTQSRLRVASVASVPSSNNLLSNLGGAAEVNRSRSMMLAAAQAAASNSSRRGNTTTNATPTAAAIAGGGRLPDLQRAYATAAAGEGGHTAPARTCSLSALRASVPRDVFMLKSSVVRSDGSFGLLSSFPAAGGGGHGGGCGAGGFPPPSLSARAFRLSNTLLQAMLYAAQVQQHHAHAQQQQQQVQQRRPAGAGGSGGLSQQSRFLVSAPPAAVYRLKVDPHSFDGSSGGSGAGAIGATTGGVLIGLCVRDCARHVQDERQPSRDVCMLMMSGGGDGARMGGGGAAAASSARGNAAAASEPSALPPTGGGSGGGGAQSLVLLGLETGDGAVLAVYLTFPTPAPMQLLEAVRDGCSVLLREHLANLVRHRLRCADLAAEWDTLRAGVPGSYLSVSRCSVVPPEPHVAAVNAAAAANGSVQYIQSPLSQPNARRVAPLLLMSAGSNVIAGGATASVAPVSEEPGFLQGALSSFRGMTSPRSRCALGSVPGSAPVPVAGSEASLASLAPGMGGGTAPGMHSQQNSSATGHASATGHVSATGPSGRGRKVSLTHGGMDDAGLTLGGPSWLQRARRSASAVPMVFTPARSTSARGIFLRQSSAKQNGGAGVGGDSTMAAAAPGADAPRSPVNSGCFHARIADGATSPTGPLTVEADDEDPAAWHDSTAAAGAAGAAAGGGGLTAAGMLTVHDLDETFETWGMRAHMGALVDSILSTTLRSSGTHLRGDDGGAGAEMAAARVTEGLEELQLSAVLGQGASGVVLKGTLGCTPVAVKIMEMPDADASVGPQAASPGGGGGGGQGLLHSSDDEGGGGAAGEGGAGGGGAGSQPQLPDGLLAAEPREVRARRALLRNAMEVALMRSISHVNIVQAFGVYDNVIMERHEGRQGIINLRRINHKDASDQKVPDALTPGTLRSSPICTAIVMELCDRGSLADVLHSRSFPALPLPPPHPSSSPAATAGTAMQYARYWKGVYMTLLEIALALRHLHSRRLVHRDLKPGNILLKSSPSDPRGWTCKLADFGFALVLDQLDQPVAEEGGQTTSHSAGAGVGGVGTGALNSSSSSHALQPPVALPPMSQPSNTNGTGNVGPRDWYTVQQHIGGTVTHMAPETFRKGSRIDASVDVFSFGVIMWELVCSRGHRPHKDLTLEAISGAVTGGTRPMFPPGDNVPLPYRQLARTCWSAEPRLRPSAAELVGVIKGLLESVRA